MDVNYSSFCDDFDFELLVNTHLELPNERDTLLNFFERITKQFPAMSTFYRRDNGDYCLESDREIGSYSWVNIELDCLSAGFSNPQITQEAVKLQKAVLDLAPHMIGLSFLDVNSLDLSLTLNFDFRGNQNEVIAEAFYQNSPFNCLLDDPNAKPISLSSGLIVSLDHDCNTQAKLTIEPHSKLYEIKIDRFNDIEPIALHFTVRRYPQPGQKFDTISAYDQLVAQVKYLMDSKIIPNFVHPLTKTISQRR